MKANEIRSQGIVGYPFLQALLDGLGAALVHPPDGLKHGSENLLKQHLINLLVTVLQHRPPLCLQVAEVSSLLHDHLLLTGELGQWPACPA